MRGLDSRIHRIAWRYSGLILCIVSGHAAAQHTDFVVARDASNTLAMEAPDERILTGDVPIRLERIESGPLAGFYALNQPGWESIEADEPDEGLFLLQTPHRVALKRLTWEPGFQMFDAALQPILENDGDTYEFAQGPPGAIHTDLFFALESGSFSIRDEVVGTFQLVDLQSTHTASDPFTLRLRVPLNAPAVSTWGVILAGLLTMAAGTWALRCAST